MAFTTQIFLFIFFPLGIICYLFGGFLERHVIFFREQRLKDWVLAGISLAFYGWALFDGMYRFFLYIVAVYLAGRLIQMCHRKHLIFPLFQTNTEGKQDLREISVSFLALCIGAFFTLLILLRFKYWNFCVPLWNAVFQVNMQGSSALAPLGISFITFSAISYLVDIHRGLSSAGSFLDCLLYFTFFPKVVSGPIVFWRDFQPQISDRRTTLDDAAAGVERIMIGFSKKLILADMLSIPCVDTISAWLSALLYMLQIYYDFAGYSDIAIGLAQIFGFHFQENFRFPYRSKSITEFWRRWHISLGSWFREYVYIPLGGSRRGPRKTLCNLAVVFALTGIWHGAGWNYIIWGGINAFFVILERIVWDQRWYQKIPQVLKYAGTMFVVMMFWALFRFQNLQELKEWGMMLLGQSGSGREGWQYYFDFRASFLTIVGVAGAVIPGNDKIQAWGKRFFSTRAGCVLKGSGLLVLFLLAILCMVNSTYHPFIYFQY